MLFTYLSLSLLLYTIRSVYIGGSTVNDHLVVVFVVFCMLPYFAGGVHFQQPLFVLGEVGIAALFAVLVRKKEASSWHMPWIWLSQPAYAISFWSYFWVPVFVLFRWLLWGEIDVSLLDVVMPVLCGGWGCIWTHRKRQHVSTHILGNKGIRVVQLSDIHASPVMRGVELDQLVSRVNALQPDVVLITGDWVMPFSEEEHSYLFRSLKGLKAPIVGAMGNHDLPIQYKFVQEAKREGIRMLIDEACTVVIRGYRIWIAGLQFHWRGAREASVSTLSSLPLEPSDYRIILAHDPRYFSWIPQHAADLVLSGHTHGGQIALNMVGIPWSPLRLLGVYDQGWFYKGTQRLYVHKGNWIWGLPPRMGVAPEIALFEL